MNELFEEIQVVMETAFPGHKEDSLLHILDLRAMLQSPYWDISKCGKLGRFKEARGKQKQREKCPKCFGGAKA